MRNGLKESRINNVQIYVDDLARYVSESYSLYTRIINSHKRQANDLRMSKTFTDDRTSAVGRICEAIDFNLNPLIEVQALLEPFVDPKLLCEFQDSGNDTNAYLKDYRYLKR